MSRDNPLWGAPRIHGELLKLGIDIGETSVGKYIARRRKPPSQTWRTFLGIENSKSVGKVALPAIVTGNHCRNNSPWPWEMFGNRRCPGKRAHFSGAADAN
jgi:hypothetical protein